MYCTLNMYCTYVNRVSHDSNLIIYYTNSNLENDITIFFKSELFEMNDIWCYFIIRHIEVKLEIYEIWLYRIN